MLSLEEIFPPFGLCISSGPVELRVLRDDDIPELLEVVRGGVQRPGTPMPFLRDWHEEPFEVGSSDALPATSLRWWWTQRAEVTPQSWSLALVTRRDGEVVGVQDMSGTDFPQRRTVATGSWLGAAHQGRGTGTLMRQLVVAFAFDHLGADRCESGYVEGNHASAAVSRKLGYQHDGSRRVVQHTRLGKVGVQEHRLVVTPATFVRPAEPVRVQGAPAVRRFLGVDAGSADRPAPPVP